MKLIIWDIDNCLADDSHRIPLIDWSTNDPTARYAAYHAACKDDPAPPTAHYALFRNLTSAGNIPLFITGRNESERSATEAWLHNFLGADVEAYGDRRATLLMRPNGCEASSVDLKHGLLSGWFHLHGGPEKNTVVMAFDDHRGILDMYAGRFGIAGFMLKIHDLDAYKGEAQLSRSDGGHQAYLDRTDDLGPRQGARPFPKSAAEVLRAMADTFEQRNGQYKDNSRMVPKMVRALFPDGVPSTLVSEEEWHLFELALVKLTRFATSNMTHIDSIHDAAVYMAMIEAILQRKSL